MTTFETLALIFYMLFAFGYMINAFCIDEETDSIWYKVYLVFVALTLGIILFPIILGINIYNKLHK